MKTILTIVFFTGALAAQSLTRFTDAKTGFTLAYPADWGKETNKELEGGAIVQLRATSPDGSAQIQVMAQPLEKQVTAAEFLTQLESALGGYANLLGEDARTVSKAQKKAVKADDIALGAYKIEGDGPGFPILNGITVFVRKKQVYILMQTVQEKQRDTHIKAVSAAVQSFKLLK